MPVPLSPLAAAADRGPSPGRARVFEEPGFSVLSAAPVQSLIMARADGMTGRRR